MRRMLPLFGSTALLFFLLVGCKGKDLTQAMCPVEPTLIERFSLCLTAEWKQETEQFGAEGSFVVNIKAQSGSGTVMQLHVKKDPLHEPVYSTLEFAEHAIAVTRDRAPNYKAVSTEPMMVSGRQTLLHIFDASPAGHPDISIRYYQFVTTNEEIAYGFTAVISPNVDEDGKEALLSVLKSVDFE